MGLDKIIYGALDYVKESFEKIREYTSKKRVEAMSLKNINELYAFYQREGIGENEIHAAVQKLTEEGSVPFAVINKEIFLMYAHTLITRKKQKNR